MAPPNNYNTPPMNSNQDEDDGFTRVVRVKKHYFNSNANNTFSSAHNYNNDNSNKGALNTSSSWIPSEVRPVLIPMSDSSSGHTATTGNTSYPNSRLWSRASLSTIDKYAALQEPNTTTATTTYAANNSTPFLMATSYSSKDKEKHDDDEVMSATSASRGSWGSDYTNLSTSTSSFSRSWSYDSRSYGRRRRGQGQYSANHNNYHHNHHHNHHHHNSNDNNSNDNNDNNSNDNNDNNNDNDKHYNDNHDNSNNHNNDNHDNNHHENSSNENNNNNKNKNKNNNNNNNNNSNDNNDKNNNDNNDNNNSSNGGRYRKWNKNKNKCREPRDIEIFVNYVRENDPIPVPLSDRYDGGSCHDLDKDHLIDGSSGSDLSREDLTKDEYDDSNENHWIDAKTLVLKDKFPKSHFHVLVLPNRVVPTLNHLINEEGVMIVKQLVDRAKIIIARESKRSPHLQFKMGFHALPSMRQVHMHVISTDMDSDNTYTISVYNSYTTAFFLTPDQLIRTIEYKLNSGDRWFMTKKDKRFYESWAYKTRPRCLLCLPAFTEPTVRCLQGQGQGQEQACPLHKHADCDMDAKLPKTAVEPHNRGVVTTPTATATGASLVADTTVKYKEKKPSSSTTTHATSTTITTAAIAITAAGPQEVWKSTTAWPSSWTARYAEYALLRQHLRQHYLEQKRAHFPSVSSSPTSPPSSSSSDRDLDNQDHDFFHDLNGNSCTSFITHNTYNDDNGGCEEDEDVLSGTTVPLLLIQDALNE
ncbi:hypothetical protein BGZ47_001630 [Haplosporangium gracile]|nr:hypothetical protein BGZ47_001630 [Haplosporangium gracile]